MMDSYEEEEVKLNFNDFNDEKHQDFLRNLNDECQKSQASSETENVNDSFLNSRTIDEFKSLSKKRKRIHTKESDHKFYSIYSKLHLKEKLKSIEKEVTLEKEK